MYSISCPNCGAPCVSRSVHVDRIYGGRAYRLNLRRCRHCGFAFLVEPPVVSYDDEYLTKEGVITYGILEKAFHARERVFGITRFVKPGPNCKFLDIGIGDGLILHQAEHLGFRGYGIDVNHAGVALARATYGLKAEVFIGDYNDAFKDLLFDVIHMNEVIEHIPDPSKLLSWCRGRLRPGGYIVVQTGNLDSLGSRLAGPGWDYIRPVHTSYFSPKSLTFALNKAGFSVSRCRSIDWRFIPATRHAYATLQTSGWRAAFRFYSIYLTAHVMGVRRTVLIHATATTFDSRVR